ncbi:MAG: hypothetical protein PF542_00170 [Nanoarchaeota archaeon]|jgi:hypothetical protein|nr:hypothetical protein [Nanoarchaeota archaeon]
MEKEKRRVSTKFVGVLAIISIIGFANIISESMANFSISLYFDSIWLFVIGIGFIVVSKPKNLYEGAKKQISDASFSGLTTSIIGALAITAAVLTLPQINVSHTSLDTIKAMISFISIIFIIFQTWVMEH